MMRQPQRSAGATPSAASAAMTTTGPTLLRSQPTIDIYCPECRLANGPFTAAEAHLTQNMEISLITVVKPIL